MKQIDHIELLIPLQMKQIYSIMVGINTMLLMSTTCETDIPYHINTHYMWYVVGINNMIGLY